MIAEPIALERYRPHIEAALSYAGETHRYEDVAAMIDAGSAQFWPGPSSVIVTEIVEYPRKIVLNIFLAGGNLTELQAMLPLVLDWAREKGCTSAVFTGRRGWARTFIKSQGWTEELVMFAKDL